jgi:hypothetical protein
VSDVETVVEKEGYRVNTARRLTFLIQTMIDVKEACEIRASAREE